MPKIRTEPTQREMAIRKLNSCKTDMNPVVYLAECLLRLLRRGVLPVPNGVDIIPNQIIPCWTGFNHNISRKRTSYRAVTYAPIIDAKPADMATVYTTMRKCKYTCLQHSASSAVAQQMNCFSPDALWEGSTLVRSPDRYTVHRLI